MTRYRSYHEINLTNINSSIGIPGPWLGRLSALVSIATAVALMKYLVTPFEKRRQVFAKSIATRIAKSISVLAGSEK